MPTSSFQLITPIIEIIMSLNPRSILDVGVGGGKYGILCREYFNYWVAEGSELRLEGIEAFPDYINDIHRFVYDKIHIGEAQSIIPRIENSFDLILLIDVFEHLDREIGYDFLQSCVRIGKSIVISVPTKWWEQEDSRDNNPYELHRAHYNWRDLRKLGFNQIFRISGQFIAIKSETRINMRSKILQWYLPLILPLRIKDLEDLIWYLRPKIYRFYSILRWYSQRIRGLVASIRKKYM